jgi:hypothetical protein
MDASPPADLRIERKSSIPFLSDPFSDDWKVTSPELAREVRNFSRAQSTPEYELPEWLNKHPEGKPRDRLTALMAVRNQSVKLSLWQRMKAALTEIGERISAYWQLFLDELGVMLALRAFVFMVGVNLLIFLLPGFRAQWRKRMQRRRCQELRAEAQAAIDRDAAAATRACYHLVRELLRLHGYEKAGGQELADYGAGAAELAAGIAQPIGAVFRAYSRCEYAPIAISTREASRVLEDTESVLERLRNP